MQKIIKPCVGSLVVIFIFAMSVFVLTISVSYAAETDADSAQSAAAASLLLEGVKAYEEGDYKRAINEFSALVSTGLRNGKLFYNLGNSYLKAGDIGRAILWYERAALLIPGDADLKFNLDYARGLTKDQQEGGELNVKRILFFWKYLLTDKTVQICAVSLNAILWGLLLLQMFIITTGRRSGVRRVSVVVGGLALIFVLTAFYNYYESSVGNEAIILPDEVIVRSGLAEGSTELFRLHAGSLVLLDRRQGEYARITFSKDMIGWIPIESVGVIRKHDS